MKDNAHLVVEYKDKGMILNPRLIEQQKISEEGIKKLKEIHLERMMLEEEMENTDDPVRLHVLAQEREHVEYRLQKVWGFPENSDYHRWWEVPKCVCPWMDNSDDYPTKYRIMRQDCPVHGILPEKNWFKRIVNYLRKKVSISFGVIALTLILLSSCATPVLEPEEYTVTDTVRVSRNGFNMTLGYQVIVKYDSSFYFGYLNTKGELTGMQNRKIDLEKFK